MSELGFDQVNDVAVDSSGNVYATGRTATYFTAKFTPSGSLVWNKDFGGTRIEVDGSDGLLVAGGGIPLLGKYDTDGNQLWNAQSSDVSGILVGGLYVGTSYLVAGSFQNSQSFTDTNPSLTFDAVGGRDVFVAKFTTDGALDRVNQFGSTETERVDDLALGPNGAPVVVGFTEGNIPAGEGLPTLGHSGGQDGYVIRAELNAIGGASTVASTVRPVESGNFRLQIHGTTGTRLHIESSTDLKTWQVIRVIEPFNGFLDFSDTEARFFRRHFYRMRVE